ncbi:MAG: hypothetical protein MMC23_007938 [Stictis urceolatum]|nr:hypothetical protein [Stictis urceolata]
MNGELQSAYWLDIDGELVLADKGVWLSPAVQRKRLLESWAMSDCSLLRLLNDRDGGRRVFGRLRKAKTMDRWTQGASIQKLKLV